jgi:hypothetical protein
MLMISAMLFWALNMVKGSSIHISRWPIKKSLKKNPARIRKSGI